ncbi:MAG: OstA-like protein [Bacteroidota bacterium]
MQFVNVPDFLSVFNRKFTIYKQRFPFPVIFLLLFVPVITVAQQNRQVEIKQANTLEGKHINGEEVRQLTGDVIFKQGNTLMYCDSALFYEKSNSIDAFGNIRIEGPQTNMTGKTLHYDGNTKQAVLTKEVTLTDGKMTLTTELLNYNTETEIADYATGGKVVDAENVLTSDKGFYYSKDKVVFFKDHVILVNPKYIIKSDTLKYHTPSATSYFYGPCNINSTGSDSSYIYCEYGWYNTRTQKSYFSRNAYIQSKENRLAGDSILYDKIAGLGRAFGNVEVTDTVQKVIISGDYAYVNEKTHRSLVTGKTQLIKIFDNDSLYMHADTLYALDDTVAKQKSYYAYNHVRIFKNDLQGKSDSLVYTTADSTMHFFNDPVLWNGVNQLTADSISLVVGSGKIQKMLLRVNSFIASQEDSLRFNQVKGKDMTGFFLENELRKIHVVGNGQTVYHIRNKKKQLSGVNRAECSDLIIFINENEVKSISLLYKPDATLYPIKETNPEEMKLKGFRWRSAIRPVSKEDIFIWK